MNPRLRRTVTGLFTAVVATAGWCAGPAAPDRCPVLSREYAYWRGEREVTPGPFLSRAPAATGVVVTCDRWPDTTDLRRFAEDAIRLSGARTQHEEALAVWRWIRRIKAQTNGDAPTEPFYERRSGCQVNDPIKILNVYGAHWCSGLGRTSGLIWRALGRRGECVHRTSHGMGGLFYRDQDDVERCHLFDVNFGGFTLDRDGRRVLTPDEFSTDFYQWMYCWYFGDPWPMPTHRMELALRQGESLSRLWGNVGKPYHDNIDPGADQRTRTASEKGPYPITFGNGVWTYKPPLDTPAWLDGLAEKPVNLAADGKLAPATAGQPASAVWRFRSPYIVVESEIEMLAHRTGARDGLRLLLSLDDGASWVECWRAPEGETGSKRLTVRLDRKFTVKPGDVPPPADLHSPFGRYAFRLKLELLAAERPGDCRIDEIVFRTTVQQALRALPQLWPGKNVIALRGELSQGSALRVTYVWDDPAGRQRRNVTVAESLPYSYEIQAGGARWEDCVCRELLVEALPATGQGSRTVVKESPAALTPLPPEPTAAETRTRWFRPGEKGRPPPLAECVKTVLTRDLKGMGRALTWLSELADPAGFEAARFAVFDPAIAGAKGMKEPALLALYNSDRAKARPVLLEVASGAEKSPWRSSPTDPAVAGGAWLSGVCVIGQMAAAAGWKEFAPMLARACGSTHCNDQHRMSLMRSIAGLAPAADAAVLEAVRQSLAMRYPYMLAEAARAAGALGDAASLPRLRELTKHDFLVVRAASLVALARLGDRDSIPVMQESLVRIPEATTLDHFKYGVEIWFCEDLRAAAAEALGILADPATLPALEAAAANEPVAWVRDVIAKAVAGTRGRVPADD